MCRIFLSADKFLEFFYRKIRLKFLAQVFIRELKVLNTYVFIYRV